MGVAYCGMAVRVGVACSRVPGIGYRVSVYMTVKVKFLARTYVLLLPMVWCSGVVRMLAHSCIVRDCDG